MLFIMATMHLTIAANVNETYELGNMFWALFGLYMVFTVLWAMRLLMRFRKR